MTMLESLPTANERVQIVVSLFENLHKKVWGPGYFLNMKGLYMDLVSINKLLFERYIKLQENLLARNEMLDGLITQFFICLFCNLQLELKRKVELLQFITLFGKNGLYRVVVFVLESLSQKVAQGLELFVDCSLSEIVVDILSHKHLFGLVNKLLMIVNQEQTKKRDEVVLIEPISDENVNRRFFI